jgi:hypothetical protein
MCALNKTLCHARVTKRLTLQALRVAPRSELVAVTMDCNRVAEQAEYPVDTGPPLQGVQALGLDVWLPYIAHVWSCRPGFRAPALRLRGWSVCARQPDKAALIQRRAESGALRHPPEPQDGRSHPRSIALGFDPAWVQGP